MYSPKSRLVRYTLIKLIKSTFNTVINSMVINKVWINDAIIHNNITLKLKIDGYEPFPIASYYIGYS